MAKGQKINTVSSINKGEAVSETSYQESLQRTLAVLKNQETVDVVIPAQLQKYLGESVPVGINGCVIVVPVDGKPHKVPKDFAPILYESLQKIQAEDVRNEVVERMGLKGSQ